MPRRTPAYPPVFLKEWREYRGLSQGELGEKLHANKWFIYRIERGAQAVSKEERDLLAEALGIISGDKLLERPPLKEPLTDRPHPDTKITRQGAIEDTMDPNDLKIRNLLESIGFDALVNRAAKMEARRQQQEEGERPHRRRKG